MSWREQNLSGRRQTREDPPWRQPETQAECPSIPCSVRRAHVRPPESQDAVRLRPRRRLASALGP